jgi:hypothetical protein
MQASLRLALASAVLSSLGAPALHAQDVTPTHTFETPMIFGSFAGELTFATMIAPPAGESIWRTDLHIEWTTDGTQSAALFGMHLSAPLDTGTSPTWTVTGADLGWGSAAGTYSAVTSTDLLNGTLVGGLFGFPPVLNLTLEAAGGGGLYGTIGVQSKLVFHLGPRMTAANPAISLLAGGSQTLNLNAGPTVGPGLFYVVVGTTSGTTPPVVLDGVKLPLVVDSYTMFTLASANSGPFVNTLGVLDGTGSATANLVVPPGSSPGLAGLVLHHSMLIADPLQGELLSASNPVELTLVP